MHSAAHAYSRAAKAGETPRETEAFVLLAAAARFQAIREDWAGKQHQLDAAITYNRKIWAILSSGVAAEDNPLPTNVKQGVQNLAMFVFKRSIDTLATPAPEKLAILISINRDVAAGLRGNAGAATMANAA